MRNILFRVIVIAIIASVGVAGSYRSYLDYRQSKESDLTLLNIEALTQDDTTYPSENGLTCNDGAGAVYEITGVNYISFYSRVHNVSKNMDDVQKYTLTYCFAVGTGNKCGSGNDADYIYEKDGSTYIDECSSIHATKEEALKNAIYAMMEKESKL